jgi:hypothetical protein
VGLDDNYFLTPGRGQEAFGDDEPVFNKVQDGSTLFAATPVEVGEGRQFNSTEEWEQFFQQLVASAPPTCGRSGMDSPDGYAQQRGWQQRGDLVEGYYRTMVGSWKGRARLSYGGNCKMFIHEPPHWLRQHDHWVCFRYQGDGWFLIHTNNVPELCAGIIEVERLLTEASRYAR